VLTVRLTRCRTNGGVEPLEIQLESAGDLVLRGFSGEELEPAVLKGELFVNLSEPTTLKDVQWVPQPVLRVLRRVLIYLRSRLVFTGVWVPFFVAISVDRRVELGGVCLEGAGVGTQEWARRGIIADTALRPVSAKVTWRDTSTHHFDHPLFFHDFSFLNPPTASAAPTKPHSHTLQAGRHVFPFSLHIPGSLPASLRTYSGTCVVEYKLKATATRPGFAADWKTRKLVRISRGFGTDAIEYNQTLEIGE
jgi:hypothetical protein